MDSYYLQHTLFEPVLTNIINSLGAGNVVVILKK